MPKVFIGVGHGGTDSGAVAKDGSKEKDYNLSIAKAVGVTTTIKPKIIKENLIKE